METFLKYVLEKTEEIVLQQEQRGDRENFLSELLTHLDLLGNTVQFLHDVSNISSLDHEDSKK